MARACALAIFLAPALASACIWDDDTLADEARGLPSALHAIVGRVDTNPPLYYEMRLEREARRFREGSRDLGLFDNCAVACDKLGRGGEALEWLERKRRQMETAGLPPRDDHRYRFHANLGTVLAHEWARSADRSDSRLLERGIAELERALEINPDAHFGRERVQVAVLRALVAQAGGGSERDVKFALSNGMTLGKRDKKSLDGLVGMMAMGGGPDQPDLVALVAATFGHRDGNLKALAKFRYDELVAAGKPTAFDAALFAAALYPSGVARPERLRPAYEKLRANADAYRARRTDFMLARLREGRHPDDDPGFWSGYEEVPPLNVDSLVPLADRLPTMLRPPYGYVSWPALGLMAVAVGVYVFRRRRL